MSPISLAMDGLLAVLLLTAVAVGVRLNGKLKLLRDGQGQFVRAVGDLDLAAGRAEAGLQALRAATEEAHDALLSRVETARALLPRLDRAAEDAVAACIRLEEGVCAADAAGRRAAAALRASPPPETSRPLAQTIPFPRLRREEAEPALAAALMAAERIVEAEVEAADPAPAPVPFPARAARESAIVAATGGDRLSRFVARRREARG